MSDDKRRATPGNIHNVARLHVLHAANLDQALQEFCLFSAFFLLYFSSVFPAVGGVSRDEELIKDVSNASTCNTNTNQCIA